MKYFKQTDSEQELKLQYNKLLSQFDYKNPKNARLLEEIDKEYAKCLRYAKMAPLRHAMDEGKRKMEEEEQKRRRADWERQQYYNSIKDRSNRKYTKEECSAFLNDAVKALQRYASSVVRSYVKANNIYRCQVDIQGFQNVGNRKTYVNLRAQRQWNTGDELLNDVIETGDNLEFAIVSLTSASNKEKALQQLEEKLGKVYVDAYMDACEKYMDSVDLARTITSANKNERFNKAVRPVESAMHFITRVVGSIVFGAIIWAIVFLIVATLADAIDSESVRDMVYVVGAILAFIVLFIFLRAFNKTMKGLTNKGISERYSASSRVTETEHYDRMVKNEENARTGTSVLRMILKMLGL